MIGSTHQHPRRNRLKTASSSTKKMGLESIYFHSTDSIYWRLDQSNHYQADFLREGIM